MLFTYENNRHGVGACAGYAHCMHHGMIAPTLSRHASSAANTI
jgi:hypothetical protein